jgi:general transcription factor 3C polypeptide 5 (transcription factor C subunit 1)
MPPRQTLQTGDTFNPVPTADTTVAAAATAEEPTPQTHSLSVPLPDQPGACNFIVEFPGYIKNEDRALATFGGLTGLASQRKTHPKNLQLRLRPGDPSCHPLISDDAKSTTVLVLQLTRSSNSNSNPTTAVRKTTKQHQKNNKGSDRMEIDVDEEDSDEDEEDTLEDDGVKARIVAVADKTYAFSAPADFQYAGHDRRPSEIQWVARADRVEDDPEFLPRQPLLCTPSLFAVEPAVDYTFKQYKAAEYGLDVLGRKPKRGMGITWVDYFAPEVPSADTKTLGGTTVGNTADANGGVSGGGGGGGSNVQQRAPLAPGLEVLVSRLEMLFSRRPVYLESALGPALGSVDVSGSGIGTSASSGSSTFTSFPATRSQQELLSRLCYRFKNGPWKGTWVLRGYDPRAEPAAREYQVLEYSLPVEWWKKVLTHKNRVTKQLQQLQLHSNVHTINTAAAGATASLGGALGLPPVAPSYNALCCFSGVQSTQTLQLQLCDINDSEVRSLLAEASNVAASVSDGSGWLTQAAWEGIKTKVAARFGALWEAAAAQAAAAANRNSTLASGATAGGGTDVGGHSSSSSTSGIIPPELMSELATYLEKGHASKPAGTVTPAAGGSGKSRAGAAADDSGTGIDRAVQGGAGGSNAIAAPIEHTEAEEEEDDDEEEEEVDVDDDSDDDDE